MRPALLLLMILSVGDGSFRFKPEEKFTLPGAKSTNKRITAIEQAQGEIKLQLREVVETVDTMKTGESNENATQEKLDNETADYIKAQVKSLEKTVSTLNAALEAQGSRLDALEKKNFHDNRYVTGGRCPYGFVKVGKKCYWFSTSTVNFYDAMSICQFFESKLAQPTSKMENDALIDYALRNGRGRSYFIGGTDIMHEQRWTWGKEDMNYSNWWPGQPSNSGNEDCIHQSTDNREYKWNDVACTSSYYFICERK